VAVRLFRTLALGAPDLRAAYFLNEGRVFVASSAILEALRFTSDWTRYLAWLRWIPRVVRDGVYRGVSRHRAALTRPSTSCRLLLPEERARFLD
jgi:predicted DCC family thiol-disulfide oxidoreductase YuxK